MKKRTPQNVLLGIFVVTGIVIFVLGVYFIGSKQNLFGDTTKIVSVFKNVNGLQSGNNVRFAGVNVGTVKSISIYNDTLIYVDLIIQNNTLKHIRKNAVANINSDGLVGSMVVNILPVVDSITHLKLKKGDTISSISNIATADMMTTLQKTNENAALLTADLLKITNAINQGDGVAGKLINDPQMATNLEQSLENLKLTTNNVNLAVKKLNNMTAEIDMENNVIGVLLKDSIAASQISQVILNLEMTSQNLTKISNDFLEFNDKLNEGKGVLNYAIQDTSLVNNVKNTMHNIEDASVKLNENLEALKHNFLFRRYFKRLERKN